MKKEKKKTKREPFQYIKRFGTLYEDVVTGMRISRDSKAKEN